MLLESFMLLSIICLNQVYGAELPASSARSIPFKQNLDVTHKQCKAIPWKRVFTPEKLSQIRQFQSEWLDIKKFPALKFTEKQVAWLTTLRSKPLPRASNIISSRSKRQAVHHIVNPMRNRKEYRQLTYSQRLSFHNALKALKTFIPDPMTGENAYDLFVKMHRGSVSPAAHGGAAFLPWHREYLLRFENALFDQGYTGPGLPFWDSTLDQTLPDPSDSLMWTSTYMGNNVGTVTSGPTIGWVGISGCSSTLQRNAVQGSIGQNYLFSDSAISDVYSKNYFSDISCTKDCAFESDHGAVHVWVGGNMGSITCAPSDPVFWMHHAFIDCIWENFRKNKQHLYSNPSTEYPASNMGGPSNAWNAEMAPFPGLINAYGISDHYTELYYECNPRPKFCTSHWHCRSGALWCDFTACRCRAKVQPGGVCTGLPDAACGGCPKFKRGACVANVCVCKPWIIAVKDTIKLPAKSPVTGGK